MEAAEKRGLQALQAEHPNHRVTVEHGVAVLTPLSPEELRRRDGTMHELTKRAAVALELGI